MDIVCRPCHINYDHVLRLETGQSDVKFFVEDILKEFSSRDDHKNVRVTINDETLARNNFQQLRTEFAKIPRKTLQAVESYYSRSMHLFGYDAVVTSNGLMTSCRYDDKERTCC